MMGHDREGDANQGDDEGRDKCEGGTTKGKTKATIKTRGDDEGDDASEARRSKDDRNGVTR